MSTKKINTRDDYAVPPLRLSSRMLYYSYSLKYHIKIGKWAILFYIKKINTLKLSKYAKFWVKYPSTNQHSWDGARIESV